MTDLTRIFAAGRVRRWHTNTALSWTDDYVDGHAGRVARLLLALHPAPTLELLAAALTHDDGEVMTGDLPWRTKHYMEQQRRAEHESNEAAARAFIWCDVPGEGERRWPLEDHRPWLDLCDNLDAWMWVQHKAPDALKEGGWPDRHRSLLTQATLLGCLEPVQALLGAAP